MQHIAAALQPVAASALTSETPVTNAAGYTCDLSAAPDCSNSPADILRLTSIQEQAIELLAAGRPDAEVAHALSVHRVTVYRWRTRHPRFISELSYRARIARLDASLSAQAALHLATNLVLHRMRSKPRKSTRLAMRVLSCARVANLASPRHRPIREILNELHQTRHPVPAQAPNPESPISDLRSPISDSPSPTRRGEEDAQLLAELAAEVSAPLPATQSQSSKRTRKPKTPPAPPTPRQDLIDAMNLYPGEFPPDLADTIALRRDLAPFDIHYIMHAPAYKDRSRARELATARPFGNEQRLSPQAILDLIRKGLITNFPNRNLAEYDIRVGDHNDLILTPRVVGPEIPYYNLWRNIVLSE